MNDEQAQLRAEPAPPDRVAEGTPEVAPGAMSDWLRSKAEARADEDDLARAISRVDWIRKTNTGIDFTITPAEQDAIRLLITDVEDRYWPASTGVREDDEARNEPAPMPFTDEDRKALGHITEIDWIIDPDDYDVLTRAAAYIDNMERALEAADEVMAEADRLLDHGRIDGDWTDLEGAISRFQSASATLKGEDE